MDKELLYKKLMEDIAPIVKKAVLLSEKRHYVQVKKYMEENNITHNKDGYFYCIDKKGNKKKLCYGYDEKPGLIKRLAEHNCTVFEDIFGHGYINLAFSEDEQTYYGWSRGFYGFKIGSEVKKGDCAYIEKKGRWKAKTLKDARQMAIDYAENLA